jgi:hypothetical protein
LYPAGFERGDSNFYSLTITSDGCIYYTISCHRLDTHGRVYRYNPATDELKLICDLGDATGETGLKALPQGKSHSPFYESDGWLYLATHYGYFGSTGDREEPAPVPEGYQPYQGGHFLRLNLATGQTEDLAKAPLEEGIITLNMDQRRGRLYGLTWPKAFFLVYDLKTRELRNLGPVSRGGEVGRGDQYFCLVRSFAVDPRDGRVYFTNADGQVHCYDPDTDRIEPFAGVTLKRSILGAWDPHRPGHQGYNWRDILWHEPHQCFYGVHPRSGWLFRFDPPARKIELLDRITTADLLRTGHFEPFRYGYLTLQHGPDGHTLYYLTSTWGLVMPDGSAATASHLLPPEILKGSSDRRFLQADDGRQFKEVTHLITYDLDTHTYADHGVLRLDDGRYIRMAQCHAVHPNGRGYTCPWIEQPASAPPDIRPQWQCDLISYPLPSAKKVRKKK